MKIKQIRNATLRINFGEADFLIDPWLIGSHALLSGAYWYGTTFLPSSDA